MTNPSGSANVGLGDARALTQIGDRSIDCIVTSPPYLNAIDYLRGHRLALVWLGWRVGELRKIRGTCIGSERAPERGVSEDLAVEFRRPVPETAKLPRRESRMLDRYVLDMFSVLSEMERVAAGGSPVVLVVGNSMIRGVKVDNVKIIEGIASSLGFELESRCERKFEASHRYLPPPAGNVGPGLMKRMKKEIVLRFRAPIRSETS